MKTTAWTVTFALTWLGGAPAAWAQVVGYTDEAQYLAALASQGYATTQEGFEDDTAWGGVRTTVAGGEQTAPSVTNLGITWSSNSVNNEITTGSGAARTGGWGVFSLPHGDYDNGLSDGFMGTGANSLIAVGGWVKTNTPPAKMGLILDGDTLNPVDFGTADALDSQFRFFGVISQTGFTQFEFRELEGTIGDQKLIFADDFTFAFGGDVLDCNENGTADGLDIANATSPDCNNNTIPDECEIAADSTAPGGPYFCTQACDPDCNVNGTPDACEVVTPVNYSSGELSPIGFGSPQSYTIVSPPLTRADVILSFTAFANLGGAGDHIAVDINGTPVGTVFGANGSDCPETQPDQARLTVPMATFNDAVAGGDAVINMVASAEVAPAECAPATFITVDAQLFVASAADANENGVPDTCEVPTIPTASTWGVLIMAVVLLSAGTVLLRRRSAV